MKLIWLNSISPFTGSKVKPSPVLESILDFLSMIENMEVAASFAFFVSDAKVLASDNPIIAKIKERKAWITGYQIKYVNKKLKIRER